MISPPLPSIRARRLLFRTRACWSSSSLFSAYRLRFLSASHPAGFDAINSCQFARASSRWLFLHLRLLALDFSGRALWYSPIQATEHFLHQERGYSFLFLLSRLVPNSLLAFHSPHLRHFFCVKMFISKYLHCASVIPPVFPHAGVFIRLDVLIIADCRILFISVPSHTPVHEPHPSATAPERGASLRVGIVHAAGCRRPPASTTTAAPAAGRRPAAAIAQRLRGRFLDQPQLLQVSKRDGVGGIRRAVDLLHFFPNPAPKAAGIG